MTARDEESGEAGGALREEIAGLLGHLTAQHRERIAGEWRRLLGGAGAITEDPAALAAVLADGAARERLRERLGALQLHAVVVAQRLPEPFLSDRLQEELILGGLGVAQAVGLVGELSGRWGLLLPAQRTTQVALQQMALHGGVLLQVLPVEQWIGLDRVLDWLDQQLSPEATVAYGVEHAHLDALCMILGIGHAFGITDLSLPPALASWEALQEALIGPGGFNWRQSRLIRVRITDAGAALLARISPELHQKRNALAGAQIHPDGRLLLPAVCNHPDMWTIARLASPEPGHGSVRTWRFSLPKWRVAQLAGTDLALVRAVLTRASGRPLPEELIRQPRRSAHRPPANAAGIAPAPSRQHRSAAALSGYPTR